MHFLTWVILFPVLFRHYVFMERFTDTQKKDLKILISFVRIYCGAKHEGQEKVLSQATDILGSDTLLCRECAAVVEHALEKRCKCPLDPKPSCKKCSIHCYGKGHRERIREIMAFAGWRMILRGRVDYLRHYFFGTVIHVM